MTPGALSSSALADDQDARLVRDLNVLSSSPSHFTKAGGTLFFTADDGVHGRELWKTDGTEAGTVLVKDIAPGPGPAFWEWAEWPLMRGSRVDGLLFFAADETPGDGSSPQLWKTDGTEAGTVKVSDVETWGELTEVNGILFFRCRDLPSRSGGTLCRSDGTEEGTGPVGDWGPNEGPDYATTLIDVNGTLFFTAYDLSKGYSEVLWKSDGSKEGTVTVTGYEDWDPSDPGSLTNVNGILFFVANNYERSCSHSDLCHLTGHHDRELWKSDGTDAGTVKIKDIYPAPGSSFPRGLTAVGDALFFTAVDAVRGRELWKTDGSEAGTVVVRDIVPGPVNSNPDDLTVLHDGTLLFTADDRLHGRELWRSDGSEQGTVMVKDMSFGPDSSILEELTGGHVLHFRADFGLRGSELWRSNGTEAGTALVADIFPGPEPSYPSQLSWSDNGLFFSANDGIHGRELWMVPGQG